MTHSYDPFTAPATTSQHDPDAEHDQQVRKTFARELAIMLDGEGQDRAAHLVRHAPTDGQWP
ncbi:hypothetical protein ACIRPH_30880 [Nocardiopsis sp. NPDC101807]|uniref:hypothetical protein n=1 Tax=Nocardiopsis sp. NPDC101807 TaxID=3364339 RepID=UPI0038279556